MTGRVGEVRDANVEGARANLAELSRCAASCSGLVASTDTRVEEGATSVTVTVTCRLSKKVPASPCQSLPGLSPGPNSCHELLTHTDTIHLRRNNRNTTTNTSLPTIPTHPCCTSSAPNLLHLRSLAARDLRLRSPFTISVSACHHTSSLLDSSPLYRAQILQLRLPVFHATQHA